LTLDRDSDLTKRYIKKVTYEMAHSPPIVIEKPPFVIDRTSHDYFD